MSDANDKPSPGGAPVAEDHQPHVYRTWVHDGITVSQVDAGQATFTVTFATEDEARAALAAPETKRERDELLLMAKRLLVVAFGGFGETEESLDREARALIARIDGAR